MTEPLALTPKQREAIRLLASLATNVCLYGGSRSGKTTVLLYSLIVRAVKTKSRHLILRQTFNAVKRSIWLDSFPKVMRLAFPELFFHPHKTDYYVTLPNGSQIFFGGLDDEKSAEKILGNEYSTIFFNEISQLDYQSIQIAKTRLAEKNSLVKKAYYDMNPPTKSHWSYWLFERKLDPGDEAPLRDPNHYASLLMNPQDNTQNIDPEYIALLEAMPEKERKRFLEGEFGDNSQGQAYYSFNREKHVVDEEAMSNGTVWVGMDFNVDPMTAVVCKVQNGKYRILDEVFLEASDTYKMADALIRRGWGGATICPDSTGRNRKTSGNSDFQILEQAGFKLASTYNPFVTDRVNNVNRLFNAGQVILHPRCKKLINDLERVQWKNDELDQRGANKHLTHISDALGYLLWKLDPITKAPAKLIQVPR